MTFVPAIPSTGIAGYQFLQRTRPVQQAAFEAQPRVARQISYFTERIASVTTVQELVADRTLREVALGAFGLDADIDSRYLIERVFDANTRDPASLVNRFSDKRYLEMSRAFGFGDIGGIRTQDAGFARRITDLFKDRQFEAATGEVDADLRLALGLDRELGTVAKRTGLSSDGRWFTLMANPPLRKVFETALGLPTSFGTLDIDRQLGEFKTRAERAFGTSDLSELNTPELRDRVRTRFLAMSQINGGTSGQTSGASIALSLLQGG